MVAPLIVAGGLAAGSAAAGLLKKKTKQEPLETPEQRAARVKLMDFANTGKFGNFEAGAEVPLGYGDFDLTGEEKTGYSDFQNFLKSDIPDQFRLGDDALRDLLQTDPARIEAQFQPVKDLVARQNRDSNTALRRNAGFAGNLYSTDTIRGLGDIEARGNETLTANLASLTNSALERRLQAIPLAYQSGEAQNAIRTDRATAGYNASMGYGSLTRQLNDARIKSRDAEILRRRKELQLPIDAATTVAGGAPPFGVPEVSSSPYQELLGLAGQIGGQYLGNEMAFGQYKRHFPTGQPSGNAFQVIRPKV